ncbi:hypothetical protein NKI50_23280 [Mesorhizobium sp. M0563]|uniref:hypothetical protein n=1 Tax=Mesorhizobium sp. M0563 TaxID=2956959 RepID=UPI00333D6BCA
MNIHKNTCLTPWRREELVFRSSRDISPKALRRCLSCVGQDHGARWMERSEGLARQASRSTLDPIRGADVEQHRTTLVCHITQPWRERPLVERIGVVELIAVTGLKLEAQSMPRPTKGIK